MAQMPHRLALVALCLLAGRAAAQPFLANLPGAPETCTAELRKSIQWGTATSAYQVEGGWNADGKSPSVWDTLVHKPGLIADGTSGDVACDMYHRWESDIALMQQLGIKNYRMSIAWPRIVPQGVSGSPINMAGINWYRSFIKALLAAGIKPAVTMYHWDLPQVLQDKYGGFLSPLVQRDFVYYADTLFQHLGDLVDQWMTFNEVISICELGYERDTFAPQVKGGLPAKYACGHNIVLAHAKTVALYRAKYAATQGGKLSIALDGKWGYPRDPANPADVKAADNFMVFQYAWIADPLYFGDYPAIMRETQGDMLPRFTDAEKVLLKSTTIDFFSVNFYCGYYIWAPEPGSPSWMTYDTGATLTSPGVPTNAAWLFKTPDGLRKTLVWLNRRYNSPAFWITENGVSGPGEETKPRAAALDDSFRTDYYKTYLDNLCAAKAVDGVNVINYFAWSLMDNFEWRDGFSKRFGLVYVDLDDHLTRHPKATAYWLARYFFSAAPPPAFTPRQRDAAGGALKEAAAAKASRKNLKGAKATIRSAAAGGAAKLTLKVNSRS